MWFQNTFFNLVLLIGTFRSSYMMIPLLMIIPSEECCETSVLCDESKLVLVMVWCHQAKNIAWTSVDIHLRHHIAPLGHNELKCLHLKISIWNNSLDRFPKWLHSYWISKLKSLWNTKTIQHSEMNNDKRHSKLLVTPCLLTRIREFIHMQHRNTTRGWRPSVVLRC